MSVRPVDITFNSSTTPGLSQLTALQWLEVTTGARQFDLALLRSLQKLQRLVLGPKVRLLAATDGSAPTGLAVISTLTALQHLALRCGAADGPHPLSAADVAALTSPSHLTCLDVSGGLIPHELYTSLLPLDRECSQLLELRATMGFLHSSRQHLSIAFERVCTSLEVVDLGSTSAGEPGGDLWYGSEHARYHDVVILEEVWNLTSLRVNVDFDEWSQHAAWCSLGLITRLRRLDVLGVRWQHFGGLIELTQLKQLTHLEVFAAEEDQEEDDDGYDDAKPDPLLSLENQASAGSPPDVWQQIPAAVLNVATKFNVTHAKNAKEQNIALLSLCQAAAVHTLQLGEKQRQQEGQLQQLQQEVAELKATVAAQQQMLLSFMHKFEGGPPQ